MTATPQPLRARAPWATRVQPVLWVLLTLALVLAVPRLPWTQTIDAVSDSKFVWIGIALLANWIVLPLWALEWHLMLPDRGAVTYRKMFAIVTVTAATLNTIPFFVGEATGLALLIGNAGLARGAGTAMIAMDQLLVGVGKLLTLAAAALLAPFPQWLRIGVASFVVIVAILATTLTLLAHWWEPLSKRLLASTSRAQLLLARIVEQGSHLIGLRQLDRLTPLVGLAIAKKTAELAAIVAVQTALGAPLSIANGLLVLAALSITTVIPVAPGNLGVYEATVFACYRFAGTSPSLALALALVQHACFLVPPIATGYLTLSLGQLRRG
jgi:uncharacterized membrane protein YbhN (UPF0104 family)